MKIVKVLNHDLTHKQLEGLQKWYNVSSSEILTLPIDLTESLLQCPSCVSKLKKLSNAIIAYCKSNGVSVVISPGGSPAFNSIFTRDCIAYGIDQLFSHSIRESSEIRHEDGSVVKRSVSNHICFIEVKACEEKGSQFCDYFGSGDLHGFHCDSEDCPYQ